MFRKIKDKIISKDLLDFSICRIVVYIQTCRTRWKVVRGHCVKRVPIRSFSGIRSEYGPEKCRIWTLFTLTYLTSSILQKKLTTFSRNSFSEKAPASECASDHLRTRKLIVCSFCSRTWKGNQLQVSYYN